MKNHSEKYRMCGSNCCNIDLSTAIYNQSARGLHHSGSVYIVLLVGLDGKVGGKSPIWDPQGGGGQAASLGRARP